MNFTELNLRIPVPSEPSMARAKAHWDGIAKPLGSLGLLEKAIIKIAGITNDPDVRLTKRAVIVVCADNGVVCEGISQSGCEVTLLVAQNLIKKQTSVCHMAKTANTEVIPVDMGMIKRLDNPLLLDRHIANGTQNIAAGPAMTQEEAFRAIEAGIDLVRNCKEEGYNILATGEMGIGNTTTSSAVASILLNKPIIDVTGRGAGLSDEGLKRKLHVIEKAIDINKPDPNDAFDILTKLGGFDIAGMTGIFLGGALYGVPIVLDGIISSVSALLAARLCPRAVGAMLASHVSDEPAGKLLLDALELQPLITAKMCLGEGTGAVTLLPLLDMALAVYHGSSTFSDIGMDSYTPLGGH